jgi:hypothetical protein
MKPILNWDSICCRGAGDAELLPGENGGEEDSDDALKSLLPRFLTLTRRGKSLEDYQKPGKILRRGEAWSFTYQGIYRWNMETGALDQGKVLEESDM